LNFDGFQLFLKVPQFIGKFGQFFGFFGPVSRQPNYGVFSFYLAPIDFTWTIATELSARGSKRPWAIFTRSPLNLKQSDIVLSICSFRSFESSVPSAFASILAQSSREVGLTSKVSERRDNGVRHRVVFDPEQDFEGFA
jgi:hypothetical protein